MIRIHSDMSLRERFCKTKHFNRGGYTLIEMIVASTASAVLMAGLAGSVVISSQAFDSSDGDVNRAISVGNIADEIMTDMRYATRFQERTATAVSFSVPDRDGDGSEETLRFAWSGTAGDPLTKEYNGSAATVLVNGVQTLNFDYMTRTIAGSIPPVVFVPAVVYLGFEEAREDDEDDELTIPTPEPTEAAEGDLLIACLTVNRNRTLSSPSGWNLISEDDADGRVTFGVWWRTAEAGEPTSHTFEWSGDDEAAYGWMMRFSGQDADEPINAFALDEGDAEKPDSPAVDSTVDSCLILRLGGFDREDIDVDVTGLSTEHQTITMDESDAGWSGVSGGAGFIIQETAGNSDDDTFELNEKRDYRTVTIAIAPAME